ncbi:MAG: HPP family protein [Phycisphaerae bacterium]|nr:HPP family protein [Phycisphaerae bacterium]
MKLFDEKFAKNKMRYILQCLLATAAVAAVVLILDAISNVAVIAALGASFFIAFTMPHANVSRARFLIGGYLAGVVSGTICFWVSQAPAIAACPLVERYAFVIFGAAAVGTAMFTMVMTNTEHPPAASVALGLVLDEWHYLTVVVILVGIVAVAALKKLLKPVMINLL